MSTKHLPVNVFKLVCIANLYTVHQRLEARGLSLTGLARKRGGDHDLFVMEACKRGLHRLLEQGLLLSSKPMSIPKLLGYM